MQVDQYKQAFRMSAKETVKFEGMYDLPLNAGIQVHEYVCIMRRPVNRASA